MFYIKEFTKLLKSNFLLGLLLLVSIFGVVTVTLQKDKISKKLSLDEQTKVIPYFNALVHSDRGLGNIRRKMKNLPGVVDIKVPSAQKITEEINYLKKNFDANLIDGLKAMSFKRIKIELENGIELKNQNLIKEYLLRLVGKDSVTIGAIKTPRKLKLQENQTLFNLLHWAESYLIILFTCLFTICLFLLNKPLSNQSFIIEKFQRKKDVSLKILLSGCGFLFLASVIVNQGFSPQFSLLMLVPLGYGIALMTFLTFKKKLKFKI